MLNFSSSSADVHVIFDGVFEYFFTRGGDPFIIQMKVSYMELFTCWDYLKSAATCRTGTLTN